MLLASVVRHRVLFLTLFFHCLKAEVNIIQQEIAILSECKHQNISATVGATSVILLGLVSSCSDISAYNYIVSI